MIIREASPFRIVPVVAIVGALLLPARAAATGSQPNPIAHVIVVQLDNTHMDDLVQMPRLMAFLRQGTIFDNDQSVLNSRTQPDMSSFTAGAYPDKTGIPEQNFFDHGYQATYSYWENHAFIHTDNGKDVDMGHPYIPAPNPWKMYNDHGWDVGGIEGHNMALENSAEVRQYHVMNAGDKNPNDYRRYGIHCAPGSSNCVGAPKGTPANAIFGAPNIPWLLNAPLLDGSGVVGPYCSHGKDCFPAIVTLSGLYAMQVHGVRATFGYIDAPHDGFDPNTKPYRDVLAEEDRAFALFFDRLAAVGINRDNTLFVITSDEGDQFAGGKERTYGLLGWMKTGTYNFDPANFNIVDGPAPLVYMKDTADVPLALESFRNIPHWQYLANQTALTAIHNSNLTDPSLSGRAPSFIVYSEADTWWYGSGDGSLRRDVLLGHAKWDHGTIAPGVNTSWLGIIGPNIRAQETGTFIDQVDAVPTMYWLLGWPIPAYLDGRILFEVRDPNALSQTARHDSAKLSQIADAYKQLNAPLGAFALSALVMSTGASLQATSSRGQEMDRHLAELVTQRNALAPLLQRMIDDTVQGNPLDRATADDLLVRANILMRRIDG